ncbi:thiol-disulfide oxidoreductase DCC family protein [Haloarcula onubensis]|uniref:Thiol-disulfide oxidoreductase DCC family protein n=1 Tax=Haloarcula onubensis TaxID=2950539 RepID=A0ABU2FQ58_9EURY|nr:thiol-disulfide oxidoreductase DCC family protein [Halomicroarcula sp. S3CR25-11]MDS0282893.1 thiol-disulfide oxidoreductase DCC family protein [Halomicroarcula sp. S3CR25-11]
MSDGEAPGSDHPVLLFDGVCNLCNGVVQFVIPRDPEGRIHFAPLQSDAGKALLSGQGLPPGALDSVVLVEDGEVYRKSDAVIRTAELLGWPYRAAAVGRAVPASVRDALYDVVADNRYDVFGRKDRCMVPDEDVQDRFLG